MARYYQFSEEQDEFIKANYLSIPKKQIARMMNVTTRVLDRRYNDLNLVVPDEVKQKFIASVKSKTGTLVGPFSDKEIQFIRENYLTMSLNQMADELGRSKAGVRQVMIRCNIEVPEKIKHQRYINSLIKKGDVPHNKGKKLPEHVKLKLQKTMFKKGNVPHNVVPIGTERETKDGYIEVKVKENSLSKNWKLKHRLVWEQHYGPIPRGCNVRFIDGDKKNCTIENLYIISKDENLEKNFFNSESLAKRVYRYTPEEIDALKKNNPHILELIELQFKVRRVLKKKTS